MDHYREPVRFHRLTDEYGCFTNFSRHPIVIDGIVWATCEHYYQAAKFTDPTHVLRIRQAPTPSRAATLGRCRTVSVRSDWDAVRVEVMRTAVRAKFVQHPQLADILLSTGNRPWIETTRHEAFWGTGLDGSGVNMNGRILTEIRAEFSTGPWLSPFAVDHRWWVAFDVTTVAVLTSLRPRGTQKVDLNVHALHLLRSAAALELSRVWVSSAPEPVIQVVVPGEGVVLLANPSAITAGAEVSAELTRAAGAPITWVNDPRWRCGGQ